MSATLPLDATLRSRVAHIAGGILGEKPPADLVHDICVDVALSRHRFRRECAFTTWIGSIVRNQVHNWIRNERTRRELMRAAAQVLARTPYPWFDDTADSCVLIDELENGFAILTERQRACLRLVGCELCSPGEAAAVLDISPTAVRMNVHRARVRLRRWLEDGK